MRCSSLKMDASHRRMVSRSNRDFVARAARPCFSWNHGRAARATQNFVHSGRKESATMFPVHENSGRVSRLVMTILLLFVATILRADTIESTTGSTIEGKITSRDAREVTIDVQVGGKTVTRHYSIRFIKAITIDGKREVLTAGPATPATPGGPATPATLASAVKKTGAKPMVGGQKTKKEVEEVIASVGKTPPDWLDATPLNFPQTLDLDFPQKPAGNWNNQKNVAQYVWDVINPNPAKWHEGLKFAYHLSDLHKGDAEVKGRVAGVIAGMYHHLFEDYARAAYWFRQSSQF